jgi:hypothetical protein
MCVTALIHAYLMPMIFMFWVASLVRKRSAFSGQPSMLIKHFFSVATALFLTLIASGYAALGLNLFIGDSDITPESWNYIFRWQPMSFVDVSTEYSSGWSHFLFNQKELLGDVEGSATSAAESFCYSSLTAHWWSLRDSSLQTPEGITLA